MKETSIKNNPILEILISTMNRTSLSFVEKIFPNNKIENLNLLIINQTQKGAECYSSFNNIRVINSYEIGLSKSRNLAIKNTIGDICLIADDDVEYVEGFESIVKETFSSIPNATIIRFKIDTFTGEKYKSYPEKSLRLIGRKQIKPTSSIEIGFRRLSIINNGIEFNELFGLGSNFPSGEEYLFLKEALKKDLYIHFENKTIVKHVLERSTTNMASDDFVSTVSAINYLEFKNFSYLLLIKYIFYLLSRKMISLKAVFKKFKVGVKAIKAYKNLTKSA